MWLGNLVIDLIDHIRHFRKPTIAVLVVLAGIFLFLNIRQREERVSDFSVKVQGWPWVCALEHENAEKRNGDILDADDANDAKELSYARQVYGLESSGSHRIRRTGLPRDGRALGNIVVALLTIGGCCVVMERYVLKPRSGDMQ